jgi:tRNA(Ile)-lysidine synthase
VPRRKPRPRSRPAKNQNLSEILHRALQQKAPLAPGERVGAAVSGGADSVALLRLLLELRERTGFVLCVVHFNHKLRGRASDADEEFVSKLAAQHGLELFVAREDIAARAKRERGNLEEVAREARYTFFQRLVKEERVRRVAVAHTADDQAETVLGHILRGTGLAGLGGIHPESGVIFRPLLAIRRAELRTYLLAKRQSWREDASNRDTKRTRARIRQKLMPLLEKSFQPAVVAHLCKLADLSREVESYIEAQAADWEHKHTRLVADGIRVELADFLAAPAAVISRVVRRIVASVKPHGGQLGAPHVEAVLQLAAQRDSGKALLLPGGVEVRRDREALRFVRMEKAPEEQGRKSAALGYCYEVDLRTGAAELRLVELSCLLHFRVIDWPAEGRETKHTGAVLDRERMSLPLVVRNWRPGDSMQPLGHQKRHKVARLLNEKSVSRWEKEIWPVLTSGGELAWVRGLPVSAEFAAGPNIRAAVLITEEPVS